MPTQSGIPLSARNRRLLAARLKERGRRVAVGRAIGVRGETIGRIVAGTRRPSEPLLHALCIELGLRCRVATTVEIEPADP
jgi:hypothetical protein